jgi:hypothetical protein
MGRLGMAFLWSAGAAAGMASGLAMAALGLAVFFWVRPRKPASTAFSVLALVWGGQVVAANLSQLAADVPTATLWFNVNVLLVIPLAVPLLAFAAAYTDRSSTMVPFLTAALAAGAGAVALLFLAAPELFGRIVIAPDGDPVLQQGPLFAPVASANVYGAFILALVLLARKLRASLDDNLRGQVALLVAGFVAYLGFRAGDLMDIALLNAPLRFSQLGPAGYGIRLGLDIAALGAVAWLLAWTLRDRWVPWRELLLFCGTVPLVFGLGEPLLQAAGIQGFFTIGLWRLLMVVLFAYAIGRYHLFDLEVRLGALAPSAAYVGVAVVAVAALWVALGDTLGRSPFLGGVATVGLAAACLPAVRAGRALASRAVPHLAEPEYLYQRKVEVYRAAVEEAAGRAMGDQTEQAFLSDLRRRLGISEREHKLISVLVQAQRKYAPAQRPSILERFRIEKELGRGGTGVAKLAYDTRLDRRVVLKQPLSPWVLDPQGRKQFLAEAKLAGRIQHPNVVTVYEVLPDEEPPVLVMEYVDGASLDRELRARGKLPAEEATRIALEVLAALERIHAEGIVHRDLKPGNILLARDGTAKVTDFGVAKPPPGVSFAVTALSQGGQPGTLAYMAPEQVQDGDVDARADLYAVGAVLFECLAGKHYLGGTGDILELRRRILTARPKVADPAIPPGLRGFLARALAKEPGERFPSARAMAIGLREALGEKPRTRARAPRAAQE